MQRMVRRRVTRVQRDHHVEGGRDERRDVAALERQPRAGAASRDVVAEEHEFVAQLDADGLRVDAQGLTEVLVRRERQVTLAAAEVGDAERLRAFAVEKAGLVQRVFEHLDEFVDLLELARHRGDDSAAGVGDP